MESKGSYRLSARFILALLCSSGVMELYMSRTNLSIAIVAMVQTVSSESSENEGPRDPYCSRDETIISFDFKDIKNSTWDVKNETLPTSNVSRSIPPIKMTSVQRGNVLSAFYYAYGLSSVFGGRLAEIYGTKKVFGAAVLADALGNFLIPIASKSSYAAFFLIRFIMGLFQGLCYPSLHCLTSVWIPPDEKSRFISFVYTSNSFGAIFSLTICGIIISAIGWEYVFYICGSISLLWLIVWISLMHDSPDEHPRISDKELVYIQESKAVTHGLKKSKKVPWKGVLLSLPLWATHIAHAGTMFGLSFMATQLPIYMSSIIGVNIKNNGMLSSAPFLARFFGSNFFSWTSNYMMKKVNWHPKIWKVILTFIGFGLTGAAFPLVGYAGCSSIAALALFSVGMAFNGAISAGYACSHFDLAPNFAGTTYGVSTLIAFLYAMIGPVLVGAITPEETLSEWVSVFWIVCASYFGTGLFYCVFISTEEQPWNEGVEEKKKFAPGTSEFEELDQRISSATTQC